MRKRSRYFGGVVVLVSLLGFTGNAGAESCSLELKKVDTSSSSREDYLYRATSSQHFYRPIGKGIRFRDDQDSAKFADIIKKEPGSYQAKHPIRGVIKLGSKSFGYVLDSSVKATGDQEEKEEKVEEREEAKAEESGGLLSNLARMLTGGKKPAEKVEPFQAVPYDRLYFDHDGDGDLTDEKIVEADSTSNYEERNYFSTSFPRIDVPIEIESAKLDFAFTLRVTAYASGDHGYVTGSVNAAAYREGEITLGGKKHRLVLIDFNSNGRFDDVPEVNTSIRTSDNRVYASSGDRLYVDPDMGATSRSPYDITSGDDLFDVSKLIHLDGRFYEMTVSPSGDKLTLEPSAVAIGYVANPTEDFCAVVYGNLGLVKIRNDESGKAPLPAGSWKLKNYTLDRTGFEQKKADPKAEPSILGVLAEALGPTVEARAPRSTIVSATATTKYEAVEVKQDETVDLPFGPPYRPMVDIEYRQGTNQVSLGMSLIGSAGETCTDMRINGNQPGKPKFTIATADGKTVAEGEFEYG